MPQLPGLVNYSNVLVDTVVAGQVVRLVVDFFDEISKLFHTT